MLFQPSNIYPSTFSGIGAGTVDVTQGLNVSWQVNGDTPMTAYQIKIYQNDSGSTLMYDSGSVTVSPAFEPHDKYGNATYFTAIISAAALSTAGIVNGYQYGYKMLITQWWGVSDYVEQTSASVFITRSTPNISIDAIPNPVAASSITITATYSQAQGDPISTVEWVFALAGSESDPIRRTGAISTQVLSFDADGLITGNTYSIMCNVVTSTGMEASTGFVQFPVLYSSSSLGINYQLAQLKNSSAVYLSWDDLGSNILAYPYTDTTKTTNGITFTVNCEGDVVASGTANADAYFTIAEGTSSQLGMTAGKKFVITSGYSGSKIVITETNGSNVVVSTIEGSDPLQYIATSTTNTLKFSIVIPFGAVLSSGQQLKPMIALEDKIVAYNDVSVNIEPIQDLHGYANPWPAGGWKNKAGPLEKGTFRESQPAGTSYANMKQANDYRLRSIDLIPINGQAATISLSDYQTYNVCITCYDADGLYLGAATGFINWKTAPYTINDPSVYYIACVIKRLDGALMTNSDIDGVHLQVELGSTATSWTPYENICPISGLTGLSVYRTGKNLIDPSKKVKTSQSIAKWYNDGVGFQLRGGQAYTLSNSLGGGTVYFYNIDGSALAYGSASKTYTPANDVYVYFQFYSATESEVDNVQFQLELGSTATTYESYNGNTYSVDWTTQAGTVYGGTLDVFTGLLTVDRECVDGGDLPWVKHSSSSSEYRNFNATTPSVAKNDSSAYTVISSVYRAQTYDDVTTTEDYDTYIRPNGSATQICVKDTSKSSLSAAAFGTAMVGVQFCYELATPITYQLTPIQVAALVTNNVWTNAEDVSVSYTTDTGAQATLTGPIVSFSNTNAQNIPTPQFIPGITGLSIYRYLQGELALQHVYDLATGATSILDYFAPSQTKVSYLLVAHSNAGDLFLQTNDFVPIFWFYSVLLCDTDSNGNYHVSREFIFKYGVETGSVSNNNDPTIQKNFTPYPNRQPISTLYKTGKVSGYIGKTNKLNQYSDTISLQNAIYDISVSPLDKFLKTRKGDVIKVDTASSIQMKTEDNTTQQALKATIDWVEVGDSEGASIVSVSTDQFWPMV